jgi:hypothetical protein
MEVQKRKNFLNLKIWIPIRLQWIPTVITTNYETSFSQFYVRGKEEEKKRRRFLKWVNENGTVSIFDFSL